VPSCRAAPACSPRGFGGSSAPRWGNVYIIRRIIRHAPSGGNPSFSRLQKLTINRQFVTGEKWNYRQNKTYLLMTKMGRSPISMQWGLPHLPAHRTHQGGLQAPAGRHRPCPMEITTVPLLRCGRGGLTVLWGLTLCTWGTPQGCPHDHPQMVVILI